MSVGIKLIYKINFKINFSTKIFFKLYCFIKLNII